MSECKQCGSCCQYLPGFFEPGKDDLLEQVANYLKISVRELKGEYLIRDYRAPFGKEIWFWTPRMVSKEGKILMPVEAGKVSSNNNYIFCSLQDYPQKAEYLGKKGGHCIFFSPIKGHCLIHPVKPFSCRLYNCSEGNNSTNWIYFHYFGGEPSSNEEKIKISQGDWAACWDFYCPKCNQDEVEYTGQVSYEENDYYEVKCANCGYQFWVY